MGTGYRKIKCPSCGKVFVVRLEGQRLPIHSPEKGPADARHAEGVCNGSDTPGVVVETVR